MELTDTLLRSESGFICAQCGSTSLAVSVGEKDGRLVVLVYCPSCGNFVEYNSGNRNN